MDQLESAFVHHTHLIFHSQIITLINCEKRRDTSGKCGLRIPKYTKHTYVQRLARIYVHISFQLAAIMQSMR